MTSHGSEDPALADDLASIRALGEGRRGASAEPGPENPPEAIGDAENTAPPEPTADANEKLTPPA